MKSLFAFILLSSVSLYGEAVIESIGFAAPDILSLTLTDQSIPKAKIIDYKVSDEDTAEVKDNYKIIKRNRRTFGILIGPEQKHLRLTEKEAYPLISRNLIDDKSRYVLEINNRLIDIVKIYRKTSVKDWGYYVQWGKQLTFKHQMFLKLPSPIKEGQLIKLKLPGFAQIIKRFKASEMLSPAIHINQNGYHPSDISQKAYFSIWLGNKELSEAVNFQTYSNFKLKFDVLDIKNKSVVTGDIIQISKAPENKTNVYEMDLSKLKLKEGTYKIKINGLGCSLPFIINKQVWEKAFITSMKGLYHSRSGIELDGRYGYKSPRSFHPDETKIYQSSLTLQSSRNGLGSISAANGAKMITGKGPDVWGGYLNSDDRGREIHHLMITWNLLNLYEAFPKYFNSFKQTLPDCDKTLPGLIYEKVKLPDLLNEALFNLDFFRRLQNENGSVKGGTAISGNPSFLAPGWLEGRKLFVYAEDPWSSFIYAATAAKAALIFRSHNIAISELFSASAERAWNWAEKEMNNEKYGNGQLTGRMKNGIFRAKVWAAAEIYRLSKQEKYANIFKKNIPCNKKPASIYGNFRRAAWTWLLSKDSDSRMNSLVKESLISSSFDNYLKSSNQSGYTTISHENKAPIPELESLALLDIYSITKSKKIATLLENGSAFILGNNPVNICFTTGLGYNTPQNPNHLDSIAMGVKPPDGLTIYGFSPKKSLIRYQSKFGVITNPTYLPDLNKTLFPENKYWPQYETYFDHPDIKPSSGYNIADTIASTACIWGYLAAIRAGYKPAKIFTLEE
jgi:endoglucanase